MKVTGVQDGSLVCFQFQTDKNGDIRIDPASPPGSAHIAYSLLMAIRKLPQTNTPPRGLIFSKDELVDLNRHAP